MTCPDCGAFDPMGDEAAWHKEGCTVNTTSEYDDMTDADVLREVGMAEAADDLDAATGGTF